MKRDPVVLIGVIEAVLGALVVFNLGLNMQMSAGIMAVVTAVSALLQAAFGTETWLALLLGAARAVISLGVLLGWNVTEQQIEALILVVSSVAGAYIRTQGQPLAAPTLKT